MKIHELLTDESKWTKGTFARNVHGNPTGINDPDACCWCLRGAAIHCYGREGAYGRKAVKLEDECYRRFNTTLIIANDRIATFQQIRQMCLDLGL